MKAVNPDSPPRAEPPAAVKSADQDITSSTTLVDATGLSVAIGAGEKMIVEWTLRFTFAAAGAVKVAVTTPSGATQLIVASMLPDAIVPASGATTVSGTAIPLAPALATAGVVTVTAAVTNSTTAGSVTLQFAQNASSGTATSLKANSCVVARRIA